MSDQLPPAPPPPPDSSNQPPYGQPYGQPPGYPQYPYGSDPDEPYISVLWGTNLEFIHHMAEIALLRDLWRARNPGGTDGTDLPERSCDQDRS